LADALPNYGHLSLIVELRLRRWQRLVHLVVGAGLIVSLLPAAAPVATVAAPQRGNRTAPA
jgi:hypothetical protein